MPLPEVIDPQWDLSPTDSWSHTVFPTLGDFARRWLIDCNLANALARLANSLPYPVYIISGFRTARRQRELLGEPDSQATSVDRSTHCSCPATGADLRLGIAVTNNIKAQFGREVRIARLRWGGGSPVDPETGIPSDWNHVDLGRRE